MTISPGVAAERTDTGNGVKIVGRWFDRWHAPASRFSRPATFALLWQWDAYGGRCALRQGASEKERIYYPYSGLATAREVNDETP